MNAGWVTEGWLVCLLYWLTYHDFLKDAAAVERRHDNKMDKRGREGEKEEGVIVHSVCWSTALLSPVMLIRWRAK